MIIVPASGVCTLTYEPHPVLSADEDPLSPAHSILLMWDMRKLNRSRQQRMVARSWGRGGWSGVLTVGSSDVEGRSQVGALHSRASTVKTFSDSTAQPVGFRHKQCLSMRLSTFKC